MRGWLLAGALAVHAAHGRECPAGMAPVPAGDYAPLIRFAGEPPSAPVEAFFLDRRPVTNAEFLAFVTAEPQWRRSRVKRIFAEPHYLGQWRSDLELGPDSPPGSPVVLVSWFAAAAYAKWRGVRLPTTVEWEWAAAAGYVSGRGRDEAAYRQAAMDWLSRPTPAPLPAAGSGRPNVYGLSDLTDLVWEWVEDFNAALVSDDSRDGSAVDRDLVCAESAAGARDLSDYPAFMRMAFRSSLRANYVVANLGFRCAASP